MRRSLLLILIGVASGPALAANPGAADTCAAKLYPDARSIYSAAAPDMANSAIGW